MSDESTIIHVGYPKTATKWFQGKFYPFSENALCIDRDWLTDTIIYPDIFNFDPQSAYGNVFKLSGGKQIIICDELLLGGLDIGYGSGEFIEHIANRLYGTFRNSKIVIFIRNQHTITESIYSHYIKSGGTYSVKKFLGYSKRLGKHFMNYHLFNPAYLYYSNIVGLYSGIFGKDNVYVYLYEDFATDPKLFLEKFCGDLNIVKPNGLDYNVRLNVKFSGISVRFMRFFNYFTNRNTPFKNYFVGFPGLYPVLISTCNYIDNQKLFRFKPFRLSDSTHRWIDETYRNENQKLKGYVDIEKLRQYGYPL